MDRFVSITPNLHLLFCYDLPSFALMELFCVAMRRGSVSRLRFHFLSHVQVFSCEISLVCRLKYAYICFSSHFCFQIIIVLLILMLSILFLVNIICLSLLFLCILRVVMSKYRRYFQCLRILFFLLYLTHIVSLCHLGDIRPYGWSLVFLFSGLFVDGLPLSTLRMAPGVLQGYQPKRLSPWWDFCYIVWFRVVFSYSWDIPFSFSLAWCYLLPIFPYIYKFHFLRVFWFFLDLIVLFLSLNCRFPFFIISTAHFLIPISWLYIFAVCARVSSYFSFWVNSLMSSMYIRRLIFSWD